MMTAKIFIIIGSLPFIVLGLLHVIYTLQDISEPKKLAPRDAGLIDAMKASPLGLTTETNMWRAWVGFNLSHGLGALFFGGIYLTLALQDISILDGMPILYAFAVMISLAYYMLARSYWFSIPRIGTGLGLAAFMAATAVSFSSRGLI